VLKVENSIEISKPVEKVFDYLTDFGNTPKWDIGVLETKQTSEGTPGLGTTFVNVGPFLGQKTTRREYKVTEYERNKKVTVLLITPSKYIQNAEVSYIFEPTPNGTKLSYTGYVDFVGILKLIQPFLQQRARKDGNGDLDNLKHLLEAQTDNI